MDKFIVIVLTSLFLVGCSSGASRKGEVEEFDWEDYRDWSDTIAEENEFVTSAYILPQHGADVDNIIEITMNHQKILETESDRLDTRLTPEILYGLNIGYKHVVMEIDIPDLPRSWEGHYDCDKKTFITDGGHPDLCPQLDEETGTFVIILPSEG
jgi:hypothetical protein